MQGYLALILAAFAMSRYLNQYGMCLFDCSLSRNSNLLQIPRSSNGGDDRSVISSNQSMQNESNKPNLNAIGNLLSAGNDAVDWLHSDIVTSVPPNISNEQKEEHQHSKSSTMSCDMKTDDIASGSLVEVDEMEDIPLIYHSDYKEMIKALPTDIVEIKEQLTELLHLWQRAVAQNESNLTVSKLKSGCNALSFFINKILKRPFAEPLRKINVYNKQYKERLSTLPRIETLLTVIGYEKDNVFWILPLLYKESDDTHGDEQRHSHDLQMEFLKVFKDILSNLFNVDGTLPITLREHIQRMKRDKLEKDNTEMKQKEDAKSIGGIESKSKSESESKLESNADSNLESNNPNGSVSGTAMNGVNTVVHTESNANIIGNEDRKENEKVSNPQNAPETQYSNKFMEVAHLVAQGKKPDDVQQIDDMPPVRFFILFRFVCSRHCHVNCVKYTGSQCTAIGIENVATEKAV